MDPFWPHVINEEKSYGDITVTLMKQFELSHCYENQLKVLRHGSENAANISLIQVKTWKKKYKVHYEKNLPSLNNCFLFSSSPDQIVDVSSNIITSFIQLNPIENQYAPIILNCISGGTERSGLVTLGVSAILATQMRKPTFLSKLVINF